MVVEQQQIQNNKRADVWGSGEEGRSIRRWLFDGMICGSDLVEDELRLGLMWPWRMGIDSWDGWAADEGMS
jgi:hypothetical protein